MNACPFAGSPRKTPPQMLLVRTMQRHLFSSPAQRHIERFSIQRFRRYHYVFRCPPLRLVRRRHPAVIERSIVFWKQNAPANLSACIKKINITMLPGNPRQRPVVDFQILAVRAKLDQITRAKFYLARFPDVNEIRRIFRKDPFAIVKNQTLSLHSLNPRKFSSFPHTFHVPDETDRHAGMKILLLFQPCFRLVPRTEHFHFTTRTMNPLSFLQLFPNRCRQLVALLMCRRYQYRTIQESPLFRILHILPGGFLQVFLLALMNEMLLFEPFKRLFKLPHRTLENSTAILFIPLTVNLRQAELLNLRIILQQPEKVA